MTFAEFQATRRWSDDLARDEPDYYNTQDSRKGKGWIYHRSLVIERVMAWWPQAMQDSGSWYLILCNLEWISDDLADLERKLYDYAVSEEIVS